MKMGICPPPTVMLPQMARDLQQTYGGRSAIMHLTVTKPPQPPRNQRVVFEHVAGPWAGMFQIVGHTDDFGGQVLPLTIGPFNCRDPFPRIGLVAALVRDQKKYVLYRELRQVTA